MKFAQNDVVKRKCGAPRVDMKLFVNVRITHVQTFKDKTTVEGYIHV